MTEKAKEEEKKPKLPRHLEEFEKLKEKIEKAGKTDFKTFLKILKAR